MAKLILEVPPEIVDAVRLPPAELEAELFKELALAIYRRGVLSLGKARKLTHMSRWQFDQLLGERRHQLHMPKLHLSAALRLQQWPQHLHHLPDKLLLISPPDVPRRCAPATARNGERIS
jgi:predicted HTH domain antitoxin